MFAEQLSKSVQAIYGALAEGDDDSRLLDVLCNQVGAEHIVMRRVCADTKDTLLSCSRLDAAGKATFLPVWRSEPFASLHTHIAPGRAVPLTAMIAPEALMGGELYQEIIRPLQGGLAAFFVFGNQSETVITAICRSAMRGQDFGEPELAR